MTGALPATPPADSPFLAEILAAVVATGFHHRRWAELRRADFPGPDGWTKLKAWCTAHGIECRIGFSHASKAADVQFSRVRATAHGGEPVVSDRR